MHLLCKKCNHLAFQTKDQLKNHSRLHAKVCKVKFFGDGIGHHEEVVALHRESTGLFKCSWCSTYQNKHQTKMQQHCRRCIGRDVGASRAASSSYAYHSLIPRGNDRESYITRELRIFVNERLHIAICKLCQYVVEEGSIFQHSVRVHGYKADKERIQFDINHFGLDKGNDSLIEYMELGVAPIDPIEGL